jgi:transposase
LVYAIKKSLQAAEQQTPAVAEQRKYWQEFYLEILPTKPEKLVFLDETSLKTNLIKLSGWAPIGQRLVDHVPHGRQGTQTLIAALRHDELSAPWVIDGAMNSELFCLYIETQLAPTLSPGDVVILDNLSSHKSKRAAQLLEQIGVKLLFLPPYSPDFNPIEMAFSKLKGLIRKSAARTYDELWKAVGKVCNLFSPNECANFFEAAGYA